MDGLPDALVSAASAEIAIHRGVDFLIGRIRVLSQQSGGRHYLASLTVSTLRDVRFNPRLLQRMGTVGREAFNSSNVLVGCGRNRGQAGGYGPAVKVDRTSSALADSAAIFCSVKIQYIPEHP